MVLDLPGERAWEVAQDLGELCWCGKGDGSWVISHGIQRPSLHTPGFSPLQLQTEEMEDAHRAQWAGLTAFPEQMSHRKGRS